jgi:hypothetical protein
LRAGLRGALADTEQTQRFVASFVRPRGIELPAVSLLADEIEHLGTKEAAPLPRPAATRLLAIALGGAAALRRARMARGRRPRAAQDAAALALEESLREEAPSRRIEHERHAKS